MEQILTFSSVIFIFVFLPLVLGIYFLLPPRFRNAFLLVANLSFYAWGEGKYVLVMIVCIVANYLFAVWIEKKKDKFGQDYRTAAKKIIAAAVLFNVLLLGYYKYTNFIVDNLNQFLGWFHVSPIIVAKVHLPIGISFFTFQALSYVIDVYRDDVRGTKRFFDFAVYKSLFPQLIAGPIVRYKHVAKELVSRTITSEQFAVGIRRFIIGLGKKVLIANIVGETATSIFSIPGNQLTTPLAWIGVTCFWLQIYFDFSGYSDMAIGLAHMLGFNFKENFNYPNISKSVSEYWDRWHLSLTSWMRDYIYFPLGGSRISQYRTYFNLMAIFFITGLWHGSSWTFICWGLYNGLFMVLERTVINVDRLKYAPVKWVYMFLALIPGYAMFKSDSISYCFSFLKAMYGFAGGSGEGHHLFLYLKVETIIALVAAAIGCGPVLVHLDRWITARLGEKSSAGFRFLGAAYPPFKLVLLFCLFALSIIKLASSSFNPFIYERF